MQTTLDWFPVKSDTVERACWVPEYRDLLVEFRSGGRYVYHNVDEPLVKRLRKSHPWHEIGAELRDPERHPYEKLGSIRTKPLKGRTVKAKKK